MMLMEVWARYSSIYANGDDDAIAFPSIPISHQYLNWMQ